MDQGIIVAIFVIVAIVFFVKYCFGMASSAPPPRPKKLTPWDEVKFFVDVNKEMSRDYTLIIDKSGSMGMGGGFLGLFGKSRWNEARDAIGYLAPHITKFDPDGITLYLFDSNYDKYEHITSAEKVNEVFSRVSPGGSTNLASVLQAAFTEHYKTKKDETILVVTDGRPDSEKAVKDAIIQATHRLLRQDELSISFIQIGNDAGATQYLAMLDDDLESQGAKFDIVDTLTTEEMGGLSFSQMVQKSILD